jgi:hypothetical protein
MRSPPRGNARHDVRVKINMTHGNRMSVANTAVVGARPATCDFHSVSPGNAPAVLRWIAFNTDALVAYWESRMYTARVVQAWKPQAPGP